MRRSRVLPLFALCAAALLGVMAWLTLTVQRLEESERRGREEAALEEAIRLALWRMESLVAPLLAQENAHPHYLYRASYPARLAATLSSDRPELANVPLVSPLAAPSSPYVRLHFQWDEKGRLSSPRVSLPRESRAAAPDGVATELLKTAARLADRDTLLSSLSSEWMHVEHPSLVSARDPTKLPTAAPTPLPAAQAEQAKQPARQSLATQQKAISTKEWQARSSSNIAVAEAFRAAAVARPSRPLTAGTSEVRVGRLEPLWLQGELVLARRVRIGSAELAQAAWLDWPATRSWLLDAIRDLLPQARLEPVAGNEQDETRRLAALPVKLVPGRLATPPELPPSRLGLPLAAAWALAGTSLLAIGALLAGMATLGERRAAFVSAVTHELRTPLTTFRMYADMLAEGMVQDEEQERQYLTTLRREAERQSHLVENVLAYSRLERGRYRAAREEVAVEDLLARLAPGLADHAARGGMTLSTPAAGECLSASVRVDRSAVERILFNLVDNACKYARQSSDRRIHLDCASDADSVRLTVSDHGPGLSPAEARRLFRPFHKSAREAAQSAPGVGLGLALSRRLARAIGGELRLVRGDGSGATFCLRLPR